MFSSRRLPSNDSSPLSDRFTRSSWSSKLTTSAAASNDYFPTTKELAQEANDIDVTDPSCLPCAYQRPRHLEKIVGAGSGAKNESQRREQIWRPRERMKTVSVALVVCLNLGVDPPDVTKTAPCARVECWIDPATLNPARALDVIGANLQSQYERWQPRARYKQSLDPTLDEVRKLASNLRRNARDERVLFHYNGHGVPRPTTNGEIWVFNQNYTQYIPLSLYDLQSWMGSPSIFVYDCSNAGIILNTFEQFAVQHEREYMEQLKSFHSTHGNSSPEPSPLVSQKNCIQLAACSASELLPMNPDLPADLFTSCLTTPIKIVLRWFIMQNQGRLAPNVTVEMLDKIPGQFNDRRTMLGELNWIFTAITDTIAWNTLNRELFQKLFRQDLLVASLFRNFLLAERIMRSYDCTPVSQPKLPPTHQHSMWQAWDLAVDMCLSQLPGIIKHNLNYVSSSFFEEQLTAFQVWLKYGNENRKPPEQLPIVLQVLLSQAHRLRALDLLSRFLDLGSWAVHLALSVGIFPYVLKLLQSSSRELRPLLVSIWAKILAVDSSCQTDLIREKCHKYFLSILHDPNMKTEHRTGAAFVLASIVHNYEQGQKEAEKGDLIPFCLEQLYDEDPLFRQWLAICLGRVWDHNETAKWRGARDNAHELLYGLLSDPSPQVRTAAVFALGTFMQSLDEEHRSEHGDSLIHNVVLHLLNAVSEDASPMVRQELIVALQVAIYAFEANVLSLLKNLNSNIESPKNRGMLSSISSPNLDKLSSVMMISPISPYGSVYHKMFLGLLGLTSDPFKDVEDMANTLLNYLKSRLNDKKTSIGKFCESEKDTSSEFSGHTLPRQSKSTNPPISKRPLLATEFIGWSTTYFSKTPAVSDINDLESQSNREKDWLRRRNIDIRLQSNFQREKMANGTGKIDEQVSVIRHPEMIYVRAFHPYSSLLAIGCKSSAYLYDVQNTSKISSISVNSPVSGLAFVNAHEKALTLIGSDDGSIRIYRHTDSTNSLVTAWYAFKGLVKKSKNKMKLAWEPHDQCLVVGGGDAKFIRIWDAEKELKINEWSSETSLTQLSCTESEPWIYAAGYFDGSIRLFDKRVPLNAVLSYREHYAPIIDMKLRSSFDAFTSPGHLVSGSSDGFIRIFDPRATRSCESINLGTDITSLSIHERAQVTSSWNSSTHTCSIHSLSNKGAVLNTIKCHEGILGQRFGNVKSIVFHPNLLMLSVITQAMNNSAMISTFRYRTLF